jgi:hypothetical protein
MGVRWFVKTLANNNDVDESILDVVVKDDMSVEYQNIHELNRILTTLARIAPDTPATVRAYYGNMIFVRTYDGGIEEIIVYYNPKTGISLPNVENTTVGELVATLWGVPQEEAPAEEASAQQSEENGKRKRAVHA